MRIRNKKKMKLTALLLCLSLFTVAAAALLSNTLTTQLSVDDPNYIIAWGTAGPPVADTILEECPFEIVCTTSEAFVYMTLHFMVESTGVDMTTVEVYLGTLSGTYAVGWYPLSSSGELDLPFNLNDGTTIGLSLRFQVSAVYDVSIVLTDTLVY